jgi:hypothetical protein
MDIWGPAKLETFGHAKYSLTVVDDATRWVNTPPMTVKSESFAKFVKIHSKDENQMNVKTKIIQCDRDGSFLSDEFRSYLENKGISYKLTVHDTPEHNGVAERRHLTLFNGVRVAVISSGLPLWLWGYALFYIAFVHNITYNRTIGMSPYQKRSGKVPSLHNLHPWGCKVIVKIQDPPSKLSPRGDECYWIGYDSESTGHKIYWPKQHKVSTEQNVTFLPTSSIIEGEQENDFNFDINGPNVEIGPVNETNNLPLRKKIRLTDGTSPPDDEKDPNDADNTDSDEYEPQDPNIIQGKRKHTITP